MSGGLMQIVAYGAQDVYLTGNPQITYFKVVYRRHTNFAVESIEQTFNGTADFGRKVTALISRSGDLIGRVYLQATLPAVSNGSSIRWVDHVGHHLIKQIEVEIGGQRIDRQYGDWLQIWYELTCGTNQRHFLGHGYDDMIGHSDAATGTSLQHWGPSHAEATLFVPLQFWFCRNVGLALPLIALQYHEVKINLEFRALSELVIAGSTISSESLASASLWVDYVYLDTEERRRFAQVSHEYLIEQLQFTGEESVTGTSAKLKLSFNHPVKELVWVAQRDVVIDGDNNQAGNQWSNYTTVPAENINNATDPSTDSARALNNVDAAKLQLNGQDRFALRTGRYFNLVQPYQAHTNIPESPGINVYSFALKPEEHNPSGSANFSRIDNATLNLTMNPSTGACKVRVYGVNYNVLRIMSGMGGLAYSN
jgi:hypothetical protein